MVICKTEGCGCPGRPFEACSNCSKREYCGSRCLRIITLEQTGIITLNPEDAQIMQTESVTLSETNKICPPCYWILQKYLRVKRYDYRGDPVYYEIRQEIQHWGRSKSAIFPKSTSMNIRRRETNGNVQERC